MGENIWYDTYTCAGLVPPGIFFSGGCLVVVLLAGEAGCFEYIDKVVDLVDRYSDSGGGVGCGY